MSKEFQPFGLDADHFAMSMDQRSLKEQILDWIRKHVVKSVPLNSSPVDEDIAKGIIES